MPSYSKELTIHYIGKQIKLLDTFVKQFYFIKILSNHKNES